MTVQRIDLKKFRDLFRQFRGKFAESPRKVRARVATVKKKNAKLADSRAVERNWSFPTAPVGFNSPGKFPRINHDADSTEKG